LLWILDESSFSTVPDDRYSILALREAKI